MDLCTIGTLNPGTGLESCGSCIPIICWHLWLSFPELLLRVVVRRVYVGPAPVILDVLVHRRGQWRPSSDARPGAARVLRRPAQRMCRARSAHRLGLDTLHVDVGLLRLLRGDGLDLLGRRELGASDDVVALVHLVLGRLLGARLCEALGLRNAPIPRARVLPAVQRQLLHLLHVRLVHLRARCKAHAHALLEFTTRLHTHLSYRCRRGLIYDSVYSVITRSPAR